ncbi:MAG TPA: response regulator [Polyangiaceae bacterium]
MQDTHSAAAKRTEAAKRILLVEDDDDDRSAMRDVLEDEGFQVFEARNGRHALDLMTSTDEPSLVILDLEMPVMSGSELVDVMRRYHRLSRVPVLVVSGSKHSLLPRHDKIVGKMAKPVELKELLETVHAAASGASANDDSRQV